MSPVGLSEVCLFVWEQESLLGAVKNACARAWMQELRPIIPTAADTSGG